MRKAVFNVPSKRSTNCLNTQLQIIMLIFYLPFEKYVVNGKEMLSFQQLSCMWTTSKASHAGAGETCYKNDGYVPFSIWELRQHVGLYIWHVLNASPRIEYKFSLQA